MAERTLIIVKPDAVHRHLVGEVIGRFEKKGLKLAAAKFMQLTEKQACQVYAAHRGKAFFEPLVKFLSSAPILVTVWEGEGVIEMARKIMGATSGFSAEPGSIRGDFSCSERYNLVHGSDSAESAQQEIEMFFKPDEIINYTLSNSFWLYSKSTIPKK